jgi:hypothetical protein
MDKMKDYIIGLLILSLTVTCSTRTNVAHNNQTKDFKDLNEKEKIGVFGQLSDEFKGDYLLYSGQMLIENESGFESSDSLRLVEMAIDKDNRFAIRFRQVEATIKTDTTEIHFIGEVHNHCIGTWKDKGDKIELHFLLGSVGNFFDIEKNKETLEAVNDTTALLDKSAEELWIMKSLCKRE